MSTTRTTGAPEQTGDSREADTARPARQEEPAAAAVLAAAGNQAMSRRGVVGDDAVAAMRADADRIVEKMKELVLDAGEEQEVLDRVQAWVDWDTSYARSGGAGTPFLDRFLQVLKGRTFARTTGRLLFGPLASDEWMNAYDALFYELEDERLERFKAIVARSGKEGTPGPTERRMDSAYSVVGKHVGLGFLGIVKQTSVAVSGLADAAAWCDWKLNGRPGKPRQITPQVIEGYDRFSRFLAENLATEDVSQKELQESFGTGDRHGQIVGMLMLAGTGQAGMVIKGTVTAAQVAQGIQGVFKAADEIAIRITKIRAANPKATWTDIISDDKVLLELLNGLAALVGVLGSVAGDQGALAAFLKRAGIAADVVAIAPMVAEALVHYTSAESAADPQLRAQTLQLDLEKIVVTIASIVAGKHDAARAQAREGGGSSQKGGEPPASGGGGGGGDGPAGGGNELGSPQVLEPHPADPNTGLIKEGPEFIPEKGVEVDPAVRDQLLEGKGSFIGEAETPVTPSQSTAEPVPQSRQRTAHADASGVEFKEPKKLVVVEEVKRPPGAEPEPTRMVDEATVPEEKPYDPHDPANEPEHVPDDGLTLEESLAGEQKEAGKKETPEDARLRPGAASLASYERAKEAGVPPELLDSGTVLTAHDYPDVLPDSVPSQGREAPDQLAPVTATDPTTGFPTEGRPVSRSDIQNVDVLHDYDLLVQAGVDPATIRINQRQTIGDQQAGTNRPDMSGELPNGDRLHIEYDTEPGTRSDPHAQRILSNDPSAIVILKKGFFPPHE